MANQQRARYQRAPSSGRVGVRKGARSKENSTEENVPPSTPTPSQRPKPRPAYKKLASKPVESYDDSDAAETLMSIASAATRVTAGAKRSGHPADDIFRQVLNLPEEMDWGTEEEDELDADPFADEEEDDESQEVEDGGTYILILPKIRAHNG